MSRFNRKVKREIIRKFVGKNEHLSQRKGILKTKNVEQWRDELKLYGAKWRIKNVK